MSTLWIDFETRSECDLATAGVYNYAMHRSTEVLCMCYAFDDGDVLTWTPDQPFPQDVFRHQGPIYAHNATFERLILWYVLQTDHKPNGRNPIPIGSSRFRGFVSGFNRRTT